MPKGTKVGQIRCCRECGVYLTLTIKRDVDRKWFCSRKCSGSWHYRNGVSVSLLGGVTEESRSKQAESLRKLYADPMIHPRWKGGTKRDRKSGYISVRLGKNNWRAEHRVIAENVLGRPLKRTEVVHHIDGDPTNNRNGNLIICSAKYHTNLHAMMSSLYQQLMWGT